MLATKMSAIIGGKRYSTTTAKLIADNAYWDGSNFERAGRNTFLYRTKNGAYFFHRRSCYQGEPIESIEPCIEAEAVGFWEDCGGDTVPFEQAFPDRVVVDA